MTTAEKLAATRNYDQLLIEINSLITGENNLMANLGNILASIKYTMKWFWVGLYKVEENELILFMFQGPHACTRIKKGIGVCGIYPYEVAETKVVQVMEYAKKNQHPLQCTLEKE